MNEIPTSAEEKEKPQLSQPEFRSEEYQDSSWELVGDPKDVLTFEPTSFKVEARTPILVDPMFADYGGLPEEEGTTRWHLPEHLSFSGIDQLKAKEQSLPTVNLTEAQLQTQLDQAYAQGAKDAAQKLNEEVETRQQAVQQQFAGVLSDLEKQLTQAISQVEREALALALEISHKLVLEAVEVNPEYILPVIEQAIAQSGNAKIKKIRVSPQDLEFINLVGVQKSIKEHDGSWEFEGDPTIRAGCIIETSAGEGDFELEKAWERIRNNVVKLVK